MHPTTHPLLLLCVWAGALLLAAHSAGAAPRVQVFGFSPEQKLPTYKGYPWDLLTTTAWRTDPELVQLASTHGTIVEVFGGQGAELMPHWGSEAKRKKWVQDTLVHMIKTGATGINFDLELPLKPGSQEAADYTALVSLASQEVHAAIPGSQVTVDVPWSPYDIDGRSYDFKGLSDAADLMFIMLYDTQSQILGRCIASANSPIDTVKKGVQQWLDLGVPPHKLVLGLPWYAYDYPCLGPAPGEAAAEDVDVCKLASVPFRGVSCSDAVGSQKCYFEVMQILAKRLNTTPVLWDEMQHSPYFNYKAADGTIHQVWFDDPESLHAKYKVASDNGLAGIGFWNLDCLDYGSSDPAVVQQTAAMWDAVRQAVAGWKQGQSAESRAGSHQGLEPAT